MDIGKYFYKPIDEVREELIGAEITDIETKGNAIHLRDKNGREYTIDTTAGVEGKGVVVHSYLTEKEEIELIKNVVTSLLEKLNIDFDELMADKGA